MGRRALLVVSDSYIAAQLLICLRDCNMGAVIFDLTGSHFLRLSRNCRAYKSVSIHEMGESGSQAAEVIANYQKDVHFEIALGAGMDATLLLARAAPILTTVRVLPTMDERALRRLNDKSAFAGLCENLGLTHPRTTLVTQDTTQLPHWYVGQEVIVKPIAKSGGRGVRRMASRDQLTDWMGRLPFDPEGPFVLQEYVPGADGVFGLVARGGELVAATVYVYAAKQRSAEFVSVPEVIAMGKKIAAFHKLNGVFEFDLRRDSRDGTWWLIECNPRFWASVALPLFAGLNFVRYGMGDSDDSGVPGAIVQPPDCEWVRVTELIRRVKRNGLGSLWGRSATWKGLRSNLADPVLAFHKHFAVSSHYMQSAISFTTVPYACWGMGAFAVV